MNQSFTIPDRFWSLNQLIAASKTHWSSYSNQEKHYRHTVWALAREAELQPVKGPCRIQVTFVEKDARRDIDGVMGGAIKPILDGLMDASVLPDDNRNWVTGISCLFPAPDKANPRIEVEILE